MFIRQNKIKIGVYWEEKELALDIDLSALMLDKQKMLLNEKCLVFFNNKKSFDGSLFLDDSLCFGNYTIGDPFENLIIELDKIDKNVSCIIFGLSTSEELQYLHFADKIEITLINLENVEYYRVLRKNLISNIPSQTRSIVFGSLNRNAEYWEYIPLNEPSYKGLEGLLAKYINEL